MRKVLLSMAPITVALVAGCGSGGDAPSDAMSGAKRVEAIASTLQACSYDGRPVEAKPAALAGSAPNDCVVAVKKVMDFTGLPANFTVVSGPVPNAAAVIMLDNNQVPRRVIAFNPKFMDDARAQVGGSPWGPISIMAHEIAHHLSGHTIVPGGSRPEIELEADKFSGFVLQKMGASRDDATRMILKVGNVHGTPTHPDKQRRAQAIAQGWNESCLQARSTGCDGSGAGGEPLSTTAPSSPSTAPTAQPAVLPRPGSIPFKYGRFVIDETGKLDPGRARAMDQRLYDLARNVGAEFTILVVNDLRGLSAQDYAWEMMRQLRVGKLDVGNGAVAVVAPRQHQAAVAFGPGFAKEAEFSNPDKQLLQWVDAAWNYCNDADGCQAWTDNLFDVFRLTLSNVEHTKWTIQYPSLGALITHYDEVNAERMRTKRAFDPATDQPLGNLIRVSGTVTSMSAPTGPGQANPRILGGALGYTAVAMKTDDGYPVALYVSPRLAGLMPAGKLKQGQRYTMVGRLQQTGDKAKQYSAMWLFSYDPL
ncbi:TPM domain-containing protein [Novosphingobium sp. 9U]|uniref:TPM domain-containing protein n=1 Tax=Novosphingobium sp. 9U TaxID=2653158 RepID=UPI0012F1F669|nr:TPM domain-containing protein [Novosphingobium sp. 9U]VWX54334.1 conserved exported hypothetical protein [Novosphingobium sp. 9U]